MDGILALLALRRAIHAAPWPGQLLRLNLLRLLIFRSRLPESSLFPAAMRTPAPVPEEVSLMSVSPKEVIRRLYKEAWNERKFDLIDQLVSQSHGLVAPNVSGAAVGPAAYK